MEAVRDQRMLEAFWELALERQLMLQRRRRGDKPPWTRDPILRDHRFTNVYRADDRVSQFLIREVLYDGSGTPEDLVFRAILFRIFNQPGTYKWLHARLGEAPTLANWDPNLYGDFLDGYAKSGGKVWNNAYMMCGVPVYGSRVKHRNWLGLLEDMVNRGVPGRVVLSRSLSQVFGILRDFPLMGDFLAMQYAIDINYSTATAFDEDDFIKPGPGAIRGAQKLFGRGTYVVGGIRLLRDTQEAALATFEGESFPWLGGSRHLRLIDIQSLLCEFDKYARLAFPEASVGPQRIKQLYTARQAQPLPAPFYPPKWGVS